MFFFEVLWFCESGDDEVVVEFLDIVCELLLFVENGGFSIDVFVVFE